MEPATASNEDEPQPNSIIWFSASNAPDIDGCISTISQALYNNPISSFLARNNPETSIAFWEEILKSAVRANKDAQQFCSLQDFSASALVVEYPRDTISPWNLMLRLMPIIPLGKWRVLGDYLNSLEKQKSAFFKAHGPFLYIMVLSETQNDSKDQNSSSAVVQSICASADASQRMLYIEARSANQRVLLKSQFGFNDVMGYRLRHNTPMLYIMARTPQNDRGSRWR